MGVWVERDEMPWAQVNFGQWQGPRLRSVWRTLARDLPRYPRKHVPLYLCIPLVFDVGPFLQGAFRVNARYHDYMSRLVKLLWNLLEYDGSCRRA